MTEICGQKPKKDLPLAVLKVDFHSLKSESVSGWRISDERKVWI